jgi:hypothetical protein
MAWANHHTITALNIMKNALPGCATKPVSEDGVQHHNGNADRRRSARDAYTTARNNLKPERLALFGAGAPDAKKSLRKLTSRLCSDTEDSWIGRVRDSIPLRPTNRT